MIARPPGLAPGMKIEIWSDVACPWCYIGKRRFEAALARVSAPDDPWTWSGASYQLDPTLPGDYERDRTGLPEHPQGHGPGTGIADVQSMWPQQAKGGGPGLPASTK